MIDEYWTWILYGYHSDDLSTQSNRPLVAMCDECCQYRVIRNDQYHDMCQTCSVSVPSTKIHRNNISASNKLREVTEKTKRKMSATRQGIPYEEWTGYVGRGEYCEKFDDACRERIRAKYDYRCFLCDMPQDNNIPKTGKIWKLSVHHVDKNRDQGCNGIKWILIPLCLHCHTPAHTMIWQSRIEWLLENVW